VRRASLLGILGALGALGACVEPGDRGGPWEPLETVDGELAGEVGPPPASSSPPPGCIVRIASFNVHYAGDPESLVAHILAATYVSGADVILVQESRAYPDEPVSRSQRLADGLGMTWVYAPTRTLPGGGTHGNAILSRFPLEDPAIRRLPYIEQPYHPEARRALAADLVLGDGERLRLVDVHLDVRLAPVDRVRQLDPAARDTDERLVVGGDFNTAPWAWLEGLVPLTASEAVVGQEQAAVLDEFMAARRFESAIPVETATMRVPGFSMRLDNLYARDLAIVAAGVEHVDGSDHWPVWADLDRCR
jgi:endonuclease/exonuclease/phosphatase family metal-dependent hydrolase